MEKLLLIQIIANFNQQKKYEENGNKREVMELYGVMLMKEDNKTEENKTKQNKTKQNKTKQNKTEENKRKQKTEHISLVQNISKLISFLLTVR